jgi:hypothetical protein
MGRTRGWLTAGLMVAAAFGLATWISGAFLLPLVLKSGADRWAVASALGVAVAALAAMWGQQWAMRDSSSESAASATEGRSITAGHDISGIASTGDNTTNTQYK